MVVDRLANAPARELSQMSLAMARGLLFDLALTGDRKAADRAMTEYTAYVRGLRQ